ncbi:hypothetical protein [Synechococcus sp. KORDI-100]|uniref:hypothetical protein n=1 Tax=Synechococcus sp. KORDI-100 TaxID=1280380 RepID=UPI00194DE3FC|nr:hypothetical protein [Synechococcus sp. KORDI-100]
MVEEHWLRTSKAIEPGEVAKAMAPELGDNARQKALQVLDALANKGIVEKQTRSDHKRRKVVSFQPLKSRGVCLTSFKAFDSFVLHSQLLNLFFSKLFSTG